ncbi:hypothetical protein BH10PSE7_BH10PSE7_24420 [soil metagenome]
MTIKRGMDRSVRPHYRESLRPRRRPAVLRYAPHVFGGLLLVASFAFAGHQMGQNAVAHGIAPDDLALAPASSSTDIVSKGSMMPMTLDFDLKTLPLTREQEVMSTAKGDYVDPDPGSSLSDPLPINLPQASQPPIVSPQSKTQHPADVKFALAPATDLVNKRLAMTPPVWKLESTFKLKRSEKQKVVAQRRLRLAEENCLAKAVYFEARSETELGQLAVAKVILNRVKDPQYPKTICGVVYQGSDRRNSCQFSFACDGMADDVRSKDAWRRSKVVAEKAIAGDQTVRIMGAATHYHADYVRPKWTHDMRRLIKIGRHIFYSDT